MAFNKVILVGNLTADPDLKQTPSGVAVVTFTLAVQRRFAKPEDAQQADFINIVAWRQQAEFVKRYFAKGSPMLVCGAIQTRNFTDQSGQKRYVTEVVADEITFVGKKSDNPRSNDNTFYGAEPPQQSYGAPAAPAADTNFQEVGGEDDLPF